MRRTLPALCILLVFFGLSLSACERAWQAGGLTGRLLCASNGAYGVTPNGFSERAPYFSGAGWVERPAVIRGGEFTSHAALVGRTPDGVVVAFRGSQPPEEWSASVVLDWLSDLNVAPAEVRDIPGQVHRGFWNALNLMWSEIRLAIFKAMDKSESERLYITGHSKGGALALIAAARLQFRDRIPVEEVVVFGTPKCGDATFAATLDSALRIRAFHADGDFIPNLPPIDRVQA
ncbi:MAG: lipase family protein, partial [Bacteroidota bacterium]